MPNPLVHWEIMAKDGKKIQEFYARLFDWHVDTNNPMNYASWTPMPKGGSTVASRRLKMAPNLVTIYVEVDDLQAYLNKAESLGGKTLIPPTVIPNMVTFALLQDPAGNAIGLVKEG